LGQFTDQIPIWIGQFGSLLRDQFIPPRIFSGSFQYEDSRLGCRNDRKNDEVPSRLVETIRDRASCRDRVAINTSDSHCHSQTCSQSPRDSPMGSLDVLQGEMVPELFPLLVLPIEETLRHRRNKEKLDNYSLIPPEGE
jgi:hypothetical protein